jgi:tRNA threonylcarbamoyladenosine modification (KEOPS) complex  Pcc1 subunit
VKNQPKIFHINSDVIIQFDNTYLCELAYNSYLPEFNKKKNKRSKISFQINENLLIFKIESDDITAFRAAINEIISFGRIIEKSLQLV